MPQAELRETDEDLIARRQAELVDSRGRHKTAMSRKAQCARRVKARSSEHPAVCEECPEVETCPDLAKARLAR
jgi:hypothetical protein